MDKKIILTIAGVTGIMAASVVAGIAANGSNEAEMQITSVNEVSTTKEVISDYDFRVQELKANGILIGDEKGNLQLGETLKRQEMVVLISRLMGKEKEAKEWDTSKLTFKDVEKENWAAGYIAWAKDNNITKGYNEEEFGYNDSLTTIQTEIFLLRVLGYEEADMDNAETMAYRTGLVYNIKNTEAKEIIRGDVGIMLYNALYIEDGAGNTLAKELGIKAEISQEEKDLKINMSNYNVEYLKKVEVEKDWVFIYIDGSNSRLSEKEEEEYKGFIHCIISAIGYKNMKIIDVASELEIIAYCNAEKRQVLALEVDGVYNYFNMKESF